MVDQFEELFTQCADEGQRRAFIAALHAAATTGHGPDQAPAALVVLGVRADFEARCADYPQLAGAVQDRYLVTAMTERQLRMAITEPARKAGSRSTTTWSRSCWPRCAAASPETSGARGAAAAVARPGPGLAVPDRAGAHPGRLRTHRRHRGRRRAPAPSAPTTRLTPAQQAAARQVFTRLTATSAEGVDIRATAPPGRT